MLKNVVIAVAVVIVSLLLYASTKPDTFEVKRSIVVNATASEVFLYVNDFHNWASWSPWEKLDPAMKRTFSGAATGVGAVYAWEGNDDVGQGRMLPTMAVDQLASTLATWMGVSPTNLATVVPGIGNYSLRDLDLFA